MDKETLSNYGWIVVCVMVLAVLLALASPFGTFVAGAIKSTTAGLFNVNQAALGSAGIDVDDMVFENCDHLETEIRNASDVYTGDTVCLECGKVLSTGEKITFAHDGDVVPDGGKYTDVNGTVYNPGDPFPEIVNTGDKYEYGDYEYRYNYATHSGSLGSWTKVETQNGWGVNTILNTKTSYGPILESINKKPLVSVRSVFYDCTALTNTGIPTIPDGVTDMGNAFQNCKAITVAPLIPDSVTIMSATFRGCSSLTNTPIIPAGVTTLWGTFYDCTSLTNEDIPEIPSGVTDMMYTFCGCTGITDASALVIPASVQKIDWMFRGCISLIKVPDLRTAKGVTNMLGLFENCTSLVDISSVYIPSNVIGISHLFQGCTSIIDASTFEIPNRITVCSGTFKNCTSLVTAPEIPYSTYNVTNMFENCTSLTGTVKFNSVATYYTDCFKGTVKPITIAGMPAGWVPSFAATSENGNVS